VICKSSSIVGGFGALDFFFLKGSSTDNGSIFSLLMSNFGACFFFDLIGTS